MRAADTKCSENDMIHVCVEVSDATVDIVPLMSLCVNGVFTLVAVVGLYRTDRYIGI